MFKPGFPNPFLTCDGPVVSELPKRLQKKLKKYELDFSDIIPKHVDYDEEKKDNSNAVRTSDRVVINKINRLLFGSLSHNLVRACFRDPALMTAMLNMKKRTRIFPCIEKDVAFVSSSRDGRTFFNVLINSCNWDNAVEKVQRAEQLQKTNAIGKIRFIVALPREQMMSKDVNGNLHWSDEDPFWSNRTVQFVIVPKYKLDCNSFLDLVNNYGSSAIYARMFPSKVAWMQVTLSKNDYTEVLRRIAKKYGQIGVRSSKKFMSIKK